MATDIDHGSARATFVPEQSDRGAGPLRVRLHDDDHEHRHGRRAAREPSLDHHRRRQPGAGSERATASSASSRGCKPERVVRVHERHRDRDARWARCAAATRWSREDGVQFDAPIPEFTLAAPRVLH